MFQKPTLRRKTDLGILGPALLVSLLLPMLLSAKEVVKRPNIVVILADDMGFSDLGCYGGEIPTPNLDALASNGIRFTQFYNTARCCPTRASLLTGLYPHRAGMGFMTGTDYGEAFPGYRADLNPKCLTIAQILAPAGYANYAVGKWHVSHSVTQDGPKHNWPLQRGFSRFYGMVSGGGSYFNPWTLCRDNTLISPQADPAYQPKHYYFTDAITDHAVQFTKDHIQQKKEEPFFLYVAYTAAHWPLHALPEDIKKHKGKYDAGYEPIRQARLAKAGRLGLVDPGQGMSPAVKEWTRVENRERESACMEVYAAMVDRMDQGIGKIVNALKESGQLDNTLILYLQDNGGCAETPGRQKTNDRVDGPRPDKPTLATQPKTMLPQRLIPLQTRDGFPVRQGPSVFPGPHDTYLSYGPAWAQVSNTPFREFKHWVHEGGISTPLIAHWPKGIATKQRNGLCPTPGHLIDIAATCADLAQARYPTQAEELPPLAGVSLRAVFEGKPWTRKEPLFWEHEGNRAVRKGEWKLVAKGPGAPWELYSITADRVEAKNLALENKTLVDSLKGQWEAWAKENRVIPWVWKPPYQP